MANDRGGCHHERIVTAVGALTISDRITGPST